MTAQELYPNRYYASYDKSLYQPTPVTGWYDTWDMSSLNLVPKAEDMIPLTKEQWEDKSLRKPMGIGVLNNELIEHKVEPVPDSLQVQAQNALKEAREYILEEYVMLAIPLPEEWIKYIRELKDVIGGNSLFTQLPIKPAN